jgi:hypothetical protein
MCNSSGGFLISYSLDSIYMYEDCTIYSGTIVCPHFSGVQLHCIQSSCQQCSITNHVVWWFVRSGHCLLRLLNPLQFTVYTGKVRSLLCLLFAALSFGRYLGPELNAGYSFVQFVVSGWLQVYHVLHQEHMNHLKCNIVALISWLHVWTYVTS